MSTSEYSDCFVVVNGPEDGTEFPVSRAPFYIGHDASCAVNVRLDTAVRARHAYLSVVSDGYRVRRSDTASVYVNGKRAGMLRSRIVRGGGLVQVGHTLLSLECASDGLASRSHGIGIESDFVWAMRQGGGALFHAGRGFVWLIARIFGRILGSWVALGAAFGVTYVMWPGFHAVVNAIFRYLYLRVQALL